MSTSSRQGPAPWQVLLVALGVLGLAAGGIVATNQPPPTPGPRSTTSTTTSAPVGPKPWGGASASWNRPVAEFGPSATLQPYAARLWTYGGGPAPPGTINVAFSDWSVPTYYARDATTTCRLYFAGWASALYTFGTAGIGAQVPCDPSWKPGGGTDRILLIIDGDRVWEIGGWDLNMAGCATLENVLVAARANDQRSTSVCTAGGQTYTNLSTFTDTTGIDGRGMGQPKAALLTRADEVRSGAIRHALELTITNTMFGAPACNPIRGPSAPGFGVDCGGYLPPATKLERTLVDTGCGAQAATPAERSKTIPEGMRFALRITDAEIEQWLDSRGYSGPIRSTARVFAVALRDYGWIVAETGCWGMHIETDSVIGTNGPTWAALGVAADGSAYPRGDLLAGLFAPDRIYVVEPPG